jgi:cytochrome c oxidase subunit I+III
MQMPGPGWPTVLAAWFTAAFFLLLTIKLVVPALVCGVVALGLVVRWMWDTDPGPAHPPVDIGGGIRLPVNCSGPQSHSWWAVVVLILVAGTVFASLLFSYFFLWTVSPDVWPAATGQALPEWWWPAGSATLLLASSALIWWAGRRLAADAHWGMRLALVFAALALAAALAVELAGQRSTGLSPVDSSYGAVVTMMAALQGLFVVTLAIMALYTLARSLCGLLHRSRRATFDNTMLLWQYAVGQGLVALVVVHLGPRVL